MELFDANFFPNDWVANDQSGCYPEDVNSDGILLNIFNTIPAILYKLFYHGVVLSKLSSMVAKGRSCVANIFERRRRPWNTFALPILPFLLYPYIAKKSGSAERCKHNICFSWSIIFSVKDGRLEEVF